MKVNPQNATLREKILSGAHKAVQKLIQHKAAENGTLVVLVDGKPCEVPAKELLKKKMK